MNFKKLHHTCRTRLMLLWRSLCRRCYEEYVISNSSLFNAKWYLETNPDVQASQLSAARHFLDHGADEGRDPSEYFSTRAYNSLHPDVKRAGFNALLHYILHGQSERRVIYNAKEGARFLFAVNGWGEFPTRRRFLPQELANSADEVSEEVPLVNAEPLSFALQRGSPVTWDAHSIFCPVDGLPQVMLGRQVLGTINSASSSEAAVSAEDVASTLEAFCRRTGGLSLFQTLTWTGHQPPLHAQEKSGTNITDICVSFIADGNLQVKLERWNVRSYIRLFQISSVDQSRLLLLAEIDTSLETQETMMVARTNQNSPVLICVNTPSGDLTALSILEAGAQRIGT
ncbi:hypothetical protein [uncultured Roseibium sp.]|uniref:hypothetical protein n=1 Tax=uncultured Roseibium sp. TaxID=1936171 RepID=UPI002594B6ED|nr:hypothetical protein [uncultured Roseibium sp.]